MGETAEEVAALDGITREESGAFALRSHRRAVAAQEAGRFDAELVNVPAPGGPVQRDEGPRPGTSMESLAKLRTVFRRDGIVTAGLSLSLSDGAAALVLASGEAAWPGALCGRCSLQRASCSRSSRSRCEVFQISVRSVGSARELGGAARRDQRRE
jgi:acetyl-CoA acetyltransferase